MNEVSRQHGWGFDGFAQVPIGDNAARIAALKAGAVDGCVVDIGSALNFVQRGDGRILMRFGDVAKNFIMHVIFATDTAIAQKPGGADRVPPRLVRDHRLHAGEQGEDGRDRQTVMGTDEKTTAASTTS